MDEQATVGAAIAAAPAVTVAGDHPFTVTDADLGDLAVATQTVDIVCATGNSYAAEWTGPTVGSMLSAADAAPETTHLVVESADDYRVTIPATGALDGVLAFLKDGAPIAETAEYANRLVCPATEGARTVKGVSRIEAVALDPGENPESLENLFPDGTRFTAKHATDEAE